MSSLPLLSETQLEGIARILGEYGTGDRITRVFGSLGIIDTSGESTKWRRINATFSKYQKQEGSPSRLIDFIRNFLEPAAFVKSPENFESVRQELNSILIFVGLEYGADGKFRRTVAAETIEEAHRRLEALNKRFRDRRLHPQVQRYCKTELLQENYFHAVFEATKGLAQRIREMSGIDGDGATLVEKVFSLQRPVLAMNTLKTETECSEHKGFAMLLKGCFAAVRNPLAHQPKILWEGEDDAADYLSLISLLHKKLDDCVVTGLGSVEDKVPF